ncbi:hypothetical protein RXV86_17225 [Alisedimentitalea sp. MJ-SS2]|uniref:hypothetical protein n=1 Tax=Aliisedimentitalea sp. MJ-SS2 TaxID=3049795 RepID=UPI00290B23DD|nr:hypothetical protein [Alisedimentitalea sp. MJ-SS2]MDU8929138.1 hypothetical protein [Alisedimentitalea sp. MJ-SS2]
MVAISDVMQKETGAGLSIAGHAPSGVLSGILGAALCFAAFGLWLVPGASFDPALLLIKLGLSVFFGLGGAMFLLAARRVHHPEVYLDGRKGILRLLTRDDRGHVESEVEVSYDELSEVDFRDGMLIARDHHGRSVVEMPVENVGDLDEIRAELGPAFSRTC